MQSQTRGPCRLPLPRLQGLPVHPRLPEAESSQVLKGRGMGWEEPQVAAMPPTMHWALGSVRVGEGPAAPTEGWRGGSDSSTV